MEGISKGLHSKDSWAFLTQGRDKAILTQNSEAQTNAREPRRRSSNSKIWCEWRRGSRRAGDTWPWLRAEEGGPAGFETVGTSRRVSSRRASAHTSGSEAGAQTGKGRCLLHRCSGAKPQEPGSGPRMGTEMSLGNTHKET